MKTLLTETMGLRAGEFNAKTVVVTGAGRGIGLQIARAFALLGGQAVVAELNEINGTEAVEMIRAEGGEATFIQTDVSSEESVRALRAAVGRVDVLVNNAIRCPVSPVVEMDAVVWDNVIAVNLRGTFLTCRAFLPEMLSRGAGVILNLISTDAMPGLSAYIASKQGILGFSQSFALETGQSGVRVIPFGPGMVDTPGIRAVSGDLAPRLGLNQEQFLGISLHAAYDGLMPAEHAGAAAAYLALRLADEYHGQSVNAYEILERAGLLKKPNGPEMESSEMPDRSIDFTVAVETLRQIVVETGLEFEKLPVFVRPIARRGFKSKSGMSLEDWGRALDSVREGKTPSGLRSSLDKLAAYYEAVPGETARFTRDREMLAQVAATCRERIRWVGILQTSLE